MVNRQAGALRQFHRLFSLGAVGGTTDAQLLARFLDRQDAGAEVAFEVLVERHGPMVLRVCRGVLRDEHAAEDAFQATFLVLARKARSIWVKDSLGSWLHGVAQRVAARARSDAMRRRRHERQAAERAAEAIRDDFHRSDTKPSSARRSPDSRRSIARRSSFVTWRRCRVRRRPAASG